MTRSTGTGVGFIKKSQVQEEYEDRLQKALNELREVYNNQMTQNRDDFAKLYETRVKN